MHPVAALRRAFLAVALCTVSQAIAAPHIGELTSLKQPDGSFVTVRVFGDEYYQRVESVDGYTLVRDRFGWINYAEVSADGSRLVPNGQIFRDASDPQVKAAPASIKRPKNKHNDMRRGKIDTLIAHNRALLNKHKPARALLSTAGAPGTGGVVTPAPAAAALPPQVTGLLLLVDFSDCPATISKTEIESYANQVNYTGYGNNGSVRDYFRSVSGDKLDYVNYVTEYYRAKYPKSYYNDTNVGYGSRATELINEALVALDARGFNFATLSTDANGEILAINTFYAGGADVGWAKGLWPHKSYLWPQFSADGVKSGEYQITSIGTGLTLRTFCHENGHMIMDWPDLYDYGYQSTGAGSYCLMAFGASELNPVPPNAYFRSLAGWETPTPINGLPANTTLRDTADDLHSYVYVNPVKTTEFFFFENRSHNGRNQYLPDSGLLIWHVDQNGSNDNEQMTPEQHYLVQVEQADGANDLEMGRNYGHAGDLFKASTKTSFTDATIPSAKWWDATNSNLAINAISAAGPVMTYNLGGVLPTYTISASVKPDTVTSGGTSWPAWVAQSYTGGAKVSYNGHNWKAKWWAGSTDVPGTAQWGPWADSGVAGGTSVVYHGTISPAGSVSVTHGTTQSFTALPSDTAWALGDFLVDGVSVGRTNPCVLTNVTTNHKVVARFIKASEVLYYLIVGRNVPPSIATTSTGGQYHKGTVVPISTALVDSNYKFVGWSCDMGATQFANANASNTTVTITDNAQVIANYVMRDTLTITATSGANGSISPSGAIPVVRGSSQTFIFTPASGYVVDSVFVNNNSVGSSSSYTFGGVYSNAKIRVTFKVSTARKFTMTTSANAGGTITPLGTTLVDSGTGFMAVATPDRANGYRVDSMIIDGVSYPGDTSMTEFRMSFGLVSADHSIRAVFRKLATVKKFTLTATAGPNGTITPSGTILVDSATVQTFTIMPMSNYLVNDVLVDGVSIGPVNTYTFTGIAANHSITATFKVKPVYTYTITASAGTGGSISPSGAVVLSEGNSATFTITPSTGYLVDSLVVDGVNQGSLATYTFNAVQTNHTIRATFKAKPVTKFTITASAGTGGSISPNGSVSIDSAKSQTYTITASTGYVIDSLSIDGVKIAGAATYTFAAIKSNHTIVATFKTSGGSICTGVATWDAAMPWTSYTVGMRRINANKLWECTNVAYSYYEPSGPYGMYGWKLIGACN